MRAEKSPAERVDLVDVSLFDHIKGGGTSMDDLRSLLAIHAAIAGRRPFSYTEIGAYLGRSLQAFVADPRCQSITVIDRRDDVSPDERNEQPLYPDNTTANMLDHLAGVPGADLKKVIAHDSSTDMLDPAVAKADLCFIDAEHTNPAALRDARFCRASIRDHGIIVFHDRTLVDVGIRQFLGELHAYRAYPLSHDLFVVEIGVPTLLTDSRVRSRVPHPAWLAIVGLRAMRPALWLAGKFRGRRGHDSSR